MLLKVILPFSLICFVLGLDFDPYIQVRNRTLTDVISSYSTRQFTDCIRECELLSYCKSVSYRETNTSCLFHDKHPIEDYAGLMVSSDNTLYYQRDCPVDWHSFDSKCYRFRIMTASWYYSRNHCASTGGNIVKIETAAEQAFIVNTITASYADQIGHFWIGAYWSTDAADFLWHDNTNIVYEAWGSTNPNIFTGCVDLSNTIAWGWNDHVDCSESLGFICEKDLIIL